MFRRDQLLAAEDAAAHLGVSPQRLRQLVSAGMLAVQRLGDRTTVYSRAELDRLKRERDGGSATSVAALMDLPPKPLALSYDGVLEVPAKFQPDLVHVRVWQSSDRDCVVVLTSPADGRSEAVSQPHWERIATSIDEQILGGAGAHACWFTLYPRPSTQSVDVDNVVCLNILNRLQKRSPYDVETPLRFEAPYWTQSSLEEICRITGAGPVELYPVQASLASTIDEFRRTWLPVDVVHDTIDLQGLIDAVQVLDAEQGSGPLARATAEYLAEETDEHLGYLDTGRWYDGRLVDDGDKYGVMVAHLVPPSLAPADEALLDRYRTHKRPEWPWSPEMRASRQALLKSLRSWREDIDEWSDEPNPRIETAITKAVGLIEFWIRTDGHGANWDAGDDSVVDGNVWPLASPRLWDCAGPADQAYVASLTRDHHSGSTRDHRILRAKIDGWIEPTTRPFFAYDQLGRLVVRVRMTSGDLIVATMWPHGIPLFGLPADATLIGDGDVGDRPIYVKYPDGRLDLLPWNLQREQWNFGYGGGGPGQLSEAVKRAYSMTHQISLAKIPGSWIWDAIMHSPQDRFEMQLGNIERRIRSTE